MIESEKIKKVSVWIVSFIMSAFFIVSALGWFIALYMMQSGHLGQEATDFGRSLNIIDHVIRTSQVVIVVAASIALILLKRFAIKLFLVCLLISLIAFMFVEKWGISFLPPTMMLPVFGYVYLINRYNFLR